MNIYPGKGLDKRRGRLAFGLTRLVGVLEEHLAERIYSDDPRALAGDRRTLLIDARMLLDQERAMVTSARRLTRIERMMIDIDRMLVVVARRFSKTERDLRGGDRDLE